MVKDKSEIKVKVFEFSELMYCTLVAKISEHHIKLSAKEKKFKIEYDRIVSINSQIKISGFRL